MPLNFSQPDALARLYARSLFELAKDAGGDTNTRVQEILTELDQVIEVARTDARFGEFLASRIVPAEARATAIDRIFSGRVSDLTLRFLGVLNRKGRLSHLPPIVAAFDEMVQEAFGRVEVDVYTATPVQTHELDAIRERLRVTLGKEPVLHAYTEPSMIGGLKMQIGDRLIDASISTSLRRMRENLNRDGAASVRAKADKFFSN